MVTLTCKSCNSIYNLNQPHPYHAGFSELGFLYCDECPTVVTWDSILDKRYNDLIELAPDRIVLVNNKGIITYANKAAAESVGLSKSSLIGKHFSKSIKFNPGEMPKYLSAQILFLPHREP